MLFKLQYMRTIGIFSGSRWPNKNKKALEQSLLALTNQLNIHDYKIAYGGGGSGLMGVIPQQFDKNGGKVLGIDAKLFADKYGIADFGEQIVCDSFVERQHKLVQESDIIVALPGGMGTIYEVMEVATYNDLKLWETDIVKPIICYNYNGYFNPLREQLLRGIEDGLILQDSYDNISWCDNIQDIYKKVTYERTEIKKQ